MEKKFIITPAIQKNLDQMEKRRKIRCRIETVANVVKAVFLISGIVMIARSLKS